MSAAGGAPAAARPYDAEAFEAFETRGWEARAQEYAARLAPVTERLAPPLLEATAVASGTRLLDVGCGPGQVAAAAARLGARAEGCDVAPAMVALARDAHPGIPFQVADALSLPFADGSFDAVVANVLVLHLARPEQAVREAARVLAPNGRFACTVYDVPAKARLVGALLDAIVEVGPAPAPQVPPGPDMFRFAAEPALDGLLEQAGLADRHVQRIAFEQELESADELWAAMTGGTVRAAALLEAQPPAWRERIRTAFAAQLEPLRDDDGRLRVPAAFLLASGVKEAR